MAPGSGTGRPVPGNRRQSQRQTAITANAIDALLFGNAGRQFARTGYFRSQRRFHRSSISGGHPGAEPEERRRSLSAPRVTTKSGQRAVIEIVREFRYPTQFDPPKIPDTVGSTSGQIGGSHFGADHSNHPHRL